MNDIQQHLLSKVRDSADEHRTQARALAADMVDSIAAGFAAGLTRDEIVDDLAAGFAQGGIR